MKLSSVQLVYSSDFLKSKNLSFDERFGAGGFYKMGEENIILFDALKKGAVIRYIPKTIAKLHINGSSWFTGKYFFDRGAVFARMFGFISPLICLLFCLKKRNFYKKELSLIQAYRQTLRGIKDFNDKRRITL